MRLLWVLLASVIGFMSAASFVVVLNEPWLDSPGPYQCYAMRTNVLGPQSWEVSCKDQNGGYLTLRFDDSLPPEADS